VNVWRSVNSVSRSLVAAALGVVAPTVVSSQAIGSGPRSISLIAIKRDEVESLDAVTVRTDSRVAVPGDTIEVRMKVDVRRDMPCVIRVALRTLSSVSVQARDADGEERRLQPGAPVPVFRGRCAASAPSHPVTLKMAGSANAPSAVSLEYEVVGAATGEPLRWVTDIALTPVPER
jgi:hypothetical protein